jgi:RimJ/RimL family protein N-acetyltransferase
MRCNQYGQPIGEALANWSARQLPGNVTLEGSFCRLEPLDAERHANDLYAAYGSAPDGRDWTYMLAGPFWHADEYRGYAETAARSTDPKHYAVVDVRLGKAVGTLSLMRVDPCNGTIEVGNVAFSPLMKQKPTSTEAQFLLMQYVFDELHYRRYEWKCDSLNAPSRKAADRLGFSFEGIFRQAVVYKGRSRDTAWYSAIDKEWPLLKAAFLAWLAANNFDSQGKQLSTLVEIRTGKSRN